MKIGENIKQKRLKLGMEAQELAAKSNISVVTLWKIETGRQNDIKVSALYQIAKNLGSSMDSLME